MSKVSTHDDKSHHASSGAVSVALEHSLVSHHTTNIIRPGVRVKVADISRPKLQT
jgi:hypothetical protein